MGDQLNNYDNIPTELRQQPLWLQYYLSPDPKKPEKKPRKHPCVKYATPDDRTANLRSLDYLIANREAPKNGGGYQRYVQPGEGFVFIDIDHVRDQKTGAVDEWAQTLISELDTYCEISASGTGFHLVCRGTLPEDFHQDPDQVEIYAGNIPNKLIAMTGDVYDLHLAIENRQQQVEALSRRAKAREFNRQAEAAKTAVSWRDAFRDPASLQTGEVRMLVKGILPEGVTFFGSNSGVGKTWMCVSLAKALITGQPFLGAFEVPEPQKVLYLIPEVGDRSLRYRLERLRVPLDGERLRVRTLGDGIMRLNDPLLVEAVREWQPVIFFDTAIRFANAKDENSASENVLLADALFALIKHGARAVVGLHHSPKSTAKADELTLENVLRGTGDLGAMCDAVWGLRHDQGGQGDGAEYAEESRNLTRLFVACVKPRDFEPADAFRVQGRPYIDERGDFALLTDTTAPRDERVAKSAAEIVAADPNISKAALARKTGISRNRLDEVLEPYQWRWKETSKTSGHWVSTTPLNKSANESIF
jgi:hypothetical protein